MNTWIQYGRGKIIKRYVRDRVTIKMIFALTEWYSNVLHDVVVGIATPAVRTWAKYFQFAWQHIPKTKMTAECGAALMTPRKGSIFPRITGLMSCKKW